jgi:quercetin dioxygenase-like cupin family protein
MNHRLLRIATTAGVVALALAAGSGAATATEETSPPASPAPPTGPISVIELAPGVTAEVFAAAPSDRAPDQTVYLARFVFENGSEIFPHSHPGTTVLGVESGTFGWTLLEGTAHVVRGAAAGNTAVEDIDAPGTEIILEVGDAIYYEDDVVHTASGAGDEPAVVLGTLVLTTGEPLLMPAEMDMSTTTP